MVAEVRTFTSAMISQCRSTGEVRTLLQQQKGNYVDSDSDLMRLRLAIDCHQVEVHTV